MTRPAILHLDQARQQLLEGLRRGWDGFGVEKVLVIEDAFGRFALGCWGSRVGESALRALLDGLGVYAASLFWVPAQGEYDPLELEASWEEAANIEDDEGNEVPLIRRIVRHRMLPAWQQCRRESLWPLKSERPCPIVSFYSFKGGMGRTTALAVFALERARRGDRVVVVDLDLDAPGLGSVLAGHGAQAAPYGVVDYLLETPLHGHRPDDLLDYSSLVSVGAHPISGSIRLFSAGQLDHHYLGKIARLDFVPTGDESLRHPLDELLLQIRAELKPDWVLLDSRTGFSETAGMVLSGLCHLHVLVGVDSEQSWKGLEYAVTKLGAERLLRGYPQGEVLLVQGLVPAVKRDARQELLERFAERARDLFQAKYFAAEEERADDAVWYVGDAIGEASPAWPWPLSYVTELAQSASIEDLLDALTSRESGFPAFCDALAKRATPGDEI